MEIIIIDDGSTDGSGELCDELKRQDDRIIVVHKKNQGLGMARNTGLEIATGKYITFLDSDDYIDSNLIGVLYEAMIKNHVDECKMGFQRVCNDHSVCGEARNDIEIFPGEKVRTEFLPRLIGSCADKHDSIEMCVCAALFNGRIIRENNLRFPNERELISEDLFFQIEYLQYANGACTLSDVSYKYRVNRESLTQNYNPKRFEKSCILYEELVKWLVSHEYDEKAILRAKRMFFVYLRACIEQEITYERQSFRKAMINIKSMCKDQRTAQVINDYPIHKLSAPQKIFLNMVKHRMAFALFFLKKINMY